MYHTEICGYIILTTGCYVGAELCVALFFFPFFKIKLWGSSFFFNSEYWGLLCQKIKIIIIRFMDRRKCLIFRTCMDVSNHWLFRNCYFPVLDAWWRKTDSLKLAKKKKMLNIDFFLLFFLYYLYLFFFFFFFFSFLHY